MGRALRIDIAGGLHHVTSRGNGGKDIFFDDDDRHYFLAILDKARESYCWLVYAYCLMDNHFHILLETIKPTLSRGMHFLNGNYSRGFNRRHGTTGHVFKNRFNSVLVLRNEHLMALSRYIVLNPVRAGIVRSPDIYRWSSYRATIGMESKPNLLSTDLILSMFSDDPEKAKACYIRFVEEGMEGEDGDLYSSSLSAQREEILCIDAQKARFARKNGDAQGSNAFFHPPLLEIFKGASSKELRNALILKAHKKYGYTQKDISSCLGISTSLVCMIINGSR